MNLRFPILVLSFLSLHGRGTAALGNEEPPPVQGRSAFTTNTALTAPGCFDAEMGLSHLHERNGGQVERLGTTQLAVGLLPGLDFRVITDGYMHVKPGEGLGSDHGHADLWYGLLWVPVKVGGWTAGLHAIHKHPTAPARDGLGSGHHDNTAMLLVQYNEGPWEFQANVLETWVGRPDGAHDRMPAASLGLVRRLNSHLSLTGEVVATTQTVWADRSYSTQWGLSWEKTPRLVFDVAVGAGLDRRAPRWMAYAGFTYAFGRIFGH